MEKHNLKRLLEDYNKDLKRIRILQEAVKEAARILSTNPPGDLNGYTPEMLNALIGSKENPKKWENYLIHMGMEKSGIKSIS